MNQENQNTEYKRIWQDENLKSICAFANTSGGTIYVGIDDEGNIESWGRGIEKIRNAGKSKGMNEPTFATEMGGVSVRFFRAGLPQSSENGTSDTSGTTLQPQNLTTLQANNLTSLKEQILAFCSEWHTIAEIAEHVRR